jgi:AcrR family transcriptional regulator
VTQPSRIGTRTQILDTARQLFSSQGYDATPLRQIADHLQLTKAALYYHFPAKELLLLELTRPFLDGMSSIVTDLRSADVYEPQAVLAAYLDLFIENIEVVSLLSREPATQHHPDIGQRARALVAAIQQQLARPEPTPARVVRTACALGVIHAVGQMPPEILDEQRNTILAAAIAALGRAVPTSSARSR